MKIDLHTHSTRSDGTMSPTELVQHAIINGITVLGLTIMTLLLVGTKQLHR